MNDYYDTEEPYEILGDIEDSYIDAKTWDIAFGLQDVDNIKPSSYMRLLAEENAAGKKKYGIVKNEISSYYDKIETGAEKTLTREADIVSLRIAEVLETKTFSFSPVALCAIHRQLFDGVLDEAIPVGIFRTYNIRKKEVVLLGESIEYADYRNIDGLLKQAFDEERNFEYNPSIGKETLAHHTMSFISGLWQIHPFGEGNTRTITTFGIKYWQQLGFSISNEPFAENAYYFRNALVFDHYLKDRHPEFLDMITGNVLLGANNDLSAGDMIKAFSP